jgi:rSAM/selenodomain-associated transferase 1
MRAEMGGLEENARRAARQSLLCILTLAAISGVGELELSTVAVAIVCKTPAAGQSKTRLSPPLRPEECAAISACFIKDVTRSIGRLVAGGGISGYALYTPQGSEAVLRTLVPEGFALIAQAGGELGARLIRGIEDLLDAGHAGAILVNADGPTLPLAILRAAAEAVRQGDNVVLSPAHDGGYTLIGLSKPHPRLFEDIPWSTNAVYRRTLDRAREIGLPVVNLPGWYDVDDQASLQMLEDELAGRPPAFAVTAGADAPATRQFLRERRASLKI